MKDPVSIRELAQQRLKEANILYDAGMYDGAYYLSGYCIELTLKAKICDRLGIPNLYDEDNKEKNTISGISEIRKALKTHNLMILLIFSGLMTKFDIDKASSKELSTANSLLFNGWNETIRYKPCGHVTENDIKKVLNNLSSKTGILSWIEQN